MPHPGRGEQHWSASRFMLYEQCPMLYKDRYVDGVATPASLPMLFGSAIHTALEAMHQGQRGTCLDAGGVEDHYTIARAVYTDEFDLMAARLPIGVVASAGLYTEGLRMLDQMARLDLNGDGRSAAERWFSLPTEATLGFATIGAVDLWSPPDSKHGAVVFDFKTTAGSWSDARAQTERWQPMLYTWAYWNVHGVIPTFRYIVLSRMNGTLETFERRWSKRAWHDDLAALNFHAEEIAEAVGEGRFDCSKGHGTCLECGHAYGHDHVCAEGSRPTKIRIAPKLKVEAGLTWLQPSLDLS